MVSVIMPTFNREKTILRAINSILQQTYKDIEIIIVDDCSTDNTQKVVESLNNNNITYIKQDKNRGACAARNEGIKLAKGEYIAFLDSDDEWLPEKVEKQIDFLQKNNVDIVFCSHISQCNGNKVIIPNKKIDSHILYRELLMENFITTGSILAKSECFKKVKFDIKLPRLQDWDLMINMGMHFRIEHLNEILTINYIQNDSMTKSHKKGFEAIKIIYSKLINTNYMDDDLKSKFCILMGNYAIDADEPAKDYFKSSLKYRAELKIFIKYIVSLLGLQRMLKRNVNN